MDKAPIVAILIKKFSSNISPLIIFLKALKTTSPPAVKYAVKNNANFKVPEKSASKAMIKITIAAAIRFNGLPPFHCDDVHGDDDVRTFFVPL